MPGCPPPLRVLPAPLFFMTTPRFIRLQQQHSGRFALINGTETLLLQQTGEIDKPTSVLFSSGLGAVLSTPFAELAEHFADVPGVIRLTSAKTGLVSLIQTQGIIVIEQTGELDKPTKVMFAGGLAITATFTLDEFSEALALVNPDTHTSDGIRESRAGIILT